MKLLIVAPFGADNVQPTTAYASALMSILESRSDFDCYLKPTSWHGATRAFTASLMTKSLVAPFDVALVIHDSEHVGMEADVFQSSRYLFAVTLFTEADDTLAERLKAFHGVQPVDETSALQLQPYTDKLFEPASPAQLVENLALLPSLPIVHIESETKAQDFRPTKSGSVKKGYSLDVFKAYFEKTWKEYES